MTDQIKIKGGVNKKNLYFEKKEEINVEMCNKYEEIEYRNVLVNNPKYLQIKKFIKIHGK